MKGNGRHLEAEADEHERADGDEQRQRVLAACQRSRQCVQVRFAAQPVDQAEAVEHHRRRHRPKEEVFQARLGRGVLRAQEASQNV